MPTYVYECRTCGQTFEVVQRMSEDPLSDCRCGAEGALRRVIQPAGVVFRGTGFHINDYAGSTTSPASPEPSSPTETAAPAPETASGSSGQD